MVSKAGKYLVLSLFTGLIHLTGHAQFNARLDYSASVDDNIYLSPVRAWDLINDVDLTLDYTLKDSATTFYYNVDYLAYMKSTERNLLLNKAGIRYNNDFGKSKQHWFYLGGYYLRRDNTEDYLYYDFQQAYTYANFRFRLNRTFIKTGYNFRYKHYDNIMALTNFQHYAFIQISRSFRTRTTLLAEADWGFKSFYTTTVTSRNDYGNGNSTNLGNEYTVTQEQIPSMSHLILLFRVAQSLHDRVGIYLQYRGQFSLNDDTWINNESFYQDEELFDDPFSYTSNGLTSRLTIILPRSFSIRAGGGLMKKDYISELSYLSEDDIPASGDLREDVRSNAYLRISKTWYLKPKWFKSVNPYLNYSFVNNNSNSFWYDYYYNFLALGVKLNF